MPMMIRHDPGMFCWADLQTRDHEAARRFYTGLFGWTPRETPIGPDRTYTMLLADGAEVAALAQLEPGNPVPSHWLNYVAVESADAIAARVEGLGGKVLAPPMDVFDAGRMAIVADPTGAWLAVWQAGRSIGARRYGDPGSLCWAELMTTDVLKAGAFWSGLFGWELETMPMSGGEYTVFKSGGKPAGGMMARPPGMDAVPPNWGTYFAVASCEATVARGGELGGKVLVPPSAIPGVGTFAVLADPQGGVFSVLQPAG